MSEAPVYMRKTTVVGISLHVSDLRSQHFPAEVPRSPNGPAPPPQNTHGVRKLRRPNVVNSGAFSSLSLLQGAWAPACAILRFPATHHRLLQRAYRPAFLHVPSTACPNRVFKPGDRVVADTGQAMSDPWGTHAEFVSCPESRFAALPASVSFEAGAALPVAGLTAWQALKGSMPLAGKRVLVLGGAGGVGHLAVQIAKSQGAYVAATCSGRNVEFVTKQLGADLAIDYTKGQKLEEAAGGAGSYDLVVDLVGGEPGAWGVLRRRGGRMAAVSFDGILQGKTGGALLLGILARVLRCKLAAALGLCPRYDIITQQQHGPGMGLEEVVGLVASGQVVPHIERVWPLAQVAEAHKHVETGRTRGRVVVRVAEADDAAPAPAASAAAVAVAPAVAG